MKTVRSIASLRENLASWRQFGETVALVPTMGNLHEGHMRLVEQARALADRVVVSVFVNPAQFGPGEDFATYPRTLDADRRRLTRADVDILFTPDVDAMYPGGIERSTVVRVPGLSDILCGAARPGHFSGVASVVTRLFTIVMPQWAFFGEKDFQQLLIIRTLVRDLHLPVAIEAVPTAREPDGLALSSRNQYLDDEARGRAPILFRALSACAERLRAGERDFRTLEREGLAAVSAAGAVPDYFAVRTPDALAEPAKTAREFVVLTAARFGRTRLIDNLQVRT
jgi:pantoate--beta-alanine ligase